EKPVSGIAMGLISDSKTGRWAVLSDILGDEDHLGDMDFKVTGTKDGITACQMDIKIDGLAYDIMEQALKQALDGRMHILGLLQETIAVPNPTVKPKAPKIVTVTIPKDFIGAVIGPGGKNIQALQAETGTTIVINEEGDLGIIEVLGTDQAGMDRALAAISNTTFSPVEGETYHVKVVKMLDFGAVVEFVPGKETLLHVSELDWKRIENVGDVLKMGDMLDVKYMGIDPKTKKAKVSRKALMPRPPREEKKADAPKQENK
ncbi:MAG: S1 RNA-binding domain-containing protein, partial [Myroides sp.]|nr:S1 RNA-binding domain-containing protein [Myroides sp.]